MAETIRKNEKCFIGNPTCGYGYESARLCFVACPSDEKYKHKLGLIEDIIKAQGYECHIALKRIDPATSAFCTKICSKIIQSQFCIVLLDLSVKKIKKKEVEYPNPNVYLEYGMMLAQNKHIIPVIDKKYSLSFNIASLDTIKYNSRNFQKELKKEIKKAIKEFSSRSIFGQMPPGPEIFTFYNLFGFKMTDIRIEYLKLLYEHGAHLGFFLFDRIGNYKYVGPFDYEDPKKAVLHTELLIKNLTSAYKNIVLFTPWMRKWNIKKGRYDYLLKKISIDIIVPASFDKNDVIKHIRRNTNKQYKYPIKVYYRKDIEDRVKSEYKKIPDIKRIT